MHVAKELLRLGASVDLRGVNTNMSSTALVMAAGVGQHPMVRLLLEHKASVDLRSGPGMTALMVAADEGFPICVQELLRGGASTKLRNNCGRTALEMVEIKSSKDHATIAKLLKASAEQQPAKPRATAPNTPDTAEARAADIQGKRDAEMATKFSETGGIEAVMAAVAKHRQQAAKPSAASSQAPLTAEARAAAEKAVVSATITEHNRQQAAKSSKDMSYL